MIWAKRALKLAAILFALTVGVSWWAGSVLIAPALRTVGPAPADLKAEVISIESDSGSTLAGWYLPSPTTRDPVEHDTGERATAKQGTVILLHGNRGDRRQMLKRARFLNHHGYTALLVDLQGHGESPGEYITAGHLERHDVSAAIRFARERKPQQPVAIIGVSLGGAATLLASPLDIDAAILESVYPTIEEAIDNRVRMRLGPLSFIANPLLLVQLEPRLGVSSSELRPIEHIAQLGCPVLIMAGNKDQHTTLAETERLFEAAASPKRLIITNGAGHGDLRDYDPDSYVSNVLTFLEEHMQPREAE